MNTTNGGVGGKEEEKHVHLVARARGQQFAVLLRRGTNAVWFGDCTTLGRKEHRPKFDVLSDGSCVVGSLVSTCQGQFPQRQLEWLMLTSSGVLDVCCVYFCYLAHKDSKTRVALGCVGPGAACCASATGPCLTSLKLWLDGDARVV